MKVVGARFRAREDAEQALHDLRSRLDIGPADAEAEAMGSTDYAHVTDGTLLAGRFRPERLPLVEDVIERHGGEILFEADEDRLGG